MAEFSLGAAIGATGKFPRYKAPETQDFISDKTKDELANLRKMVSTDDKVYHSIYVPSVKDATVKFIDEQANLQKQRDPEIVAKTQKALADWRESSNLYLNKSANLKNLETFAEKGGSIGQYVPESVKKARDLIVTSKTESEMLEKFKQNPDIFADGYIAFDPETGTVKYTADDIFDFKGYVNKELLKKQFARVEFEKIETKNNVRSKTTVLTIPADEAEAKAMREAAIKRDGRDPGEYSNAYDMGYNWFVNNPMAQRQYKSIKYWQGQKDVLDKSIDEVYKDFYNEYILTSIPEYQKGTDMYVGSRNINVYNPGGVTTPTGYARQPQLTINYGLGDIVAKSTSNLSKTAGGTEVRMPKNKYIINMKTGTSAFKSDDVTQGVFYISTISVMPTVKLKDGTYRPLADKEAVELTKQGRKLMYIPWALADEQRLVVGSLPTIGKATYAVPLFEPTNGKLVIPKTARTGDNPDAISYVLGSIFRDQKLSREQQVEWKKVYREMMADVVDETESK